MGLLGHLLGRIFFGLGILAAGFNALFTGLNSEFFTAAGWLTAFVWGAGLWIATRDGSVV